MQYLRKMSANTPPGNSDGEFCKYSYGESDQMCGDCVLRLVFRRRIYRWGCPAKRCRKSRLEDTRPRCGLYSEVFGPEARVLRARGDLGAVRKGFGGG